MLRMHKTYQKAGVCEWHKKGSSNPLQKLQLLTQLNLHEFSFCNLFPGPLGPCHRFAPYCLLSTRHCHLLGLTYILCPALFMQYFFATSSHLAKASIYIYIYIRLTERLWGEQFGVMMTTVHLKVICLDCVENMHLPQCRCQHKTINLPHLHKMPWCLKKHLEQQQQQGRAQ